MIALLSSRYRLSRREVAAVCAEVLGAAVSVAATCRQQDRSLLAYLTVVCTAAQCGHPIPSLLPAPTAPQAA